MPEINHVDKVPTFNLYGRTLVTKTVVDKFVHQPYAIWLSPVATSVITYKNATRCSHAQTARYTELIRTNVRRHDLGGN